MKLKYTSKVENYFRKKSIISNIEKEYEKIPVITTDNYIVLGQLTALRFLEWVCENPGGVVALPTGKTPEFFIKWTQHYLKNWDSEINKGVLEEIGFKANQKPNMKSLHFLQLDEFFPIHPDHERSFIYFVKKYYIEGFGFDPAKAKLIDTYTMNAARKKVLGDMDNIARVFPDGIIDLSLRIKQPSTKLEELQKKTIKYFDQFCEDFEEDVRSLGGIGFFLGGIGPDGHIAFNVKGSSHHSPTRLTNVNYETQAAAAGDLGGIESVRKKAVITIGLETITYNPDAVAIIIAAGQAKAKVVSDALENEPALEYPASSLQKLPNARFYITETAASTLKERVIRIFHKSADVPDSTIEKLMIDGCYRSSTKLMELINNPQKIAKNSVKEWRLAKSLRKKSVEDLAQKTHNDIVKKIQNGLNIPQNERFLHTAPHHDDIELAYFPVLHHLVRSEYNKNDFVYCTSGFTAVTNEYVLTRMQYLYKFLTNGQLIKQYGKKNLMDVNLGQDDIIGALNSIAGQSQEDHDFHIASRLARCMFTYLKTDSELDLKNFIDDQIKQIGRLSPGQVDTEIVQLIKGWIREFEAELVWGLFGIDKKHVHHLRLQFYTGDIFPSYPDYKGDVLPVFNLLDKLKPTIITVALDPEGSGPDTHYKTLIAIAQAIDKYIEKYPDMNIRIWGYRNVWTRFEPSEVSMIVPVSLNSFAVLHDMFDHCFLSQKSASFPSYELDGTFSQLAQKIWVDQFNDLVKLLGKRYFYENTNPLMRRSYGAIFIKDMNYQDFVEEMKPIRRLLEVKKELNPHEGKK